MSIYDVIGEISEQKALKTETGDKRINGVVVGLVTQNYDKDMPGRVCVAIPTRDKDANELKWARQVLPGSGSKWGYYFLPEVGDQVLLAFEGGNIEKPYIIGCIPKDDSKLISKTVDKDNQFKRLMTRNGSAIIFEDNKEGEGDKDKITLETAKQAHTVVLDNENKAIRISDKAKENMMQISTESGEILLKAKSKVTIQVGDKVKIILNGESGGVQIQASDVSIQSEKQIKLKATDMMKIEGSQISQSASSIKAESSGMVTISGSPIKIG